MVSLLTWGGCLSARERGREKKAVYVLLIRESLCIRNLLYSFSQASCYSFIYSIQNRSNHFHSEQPSSSLAFRLIPFAAWGSCIRWLPRLLFVGVRSFVCWSVSLKLPLWAKYHPINCTGHLSPPILFLIFSFSSLSLSLIFFFHHHLIIKWLPFVCSILPPFPLDSLTSGLVKLSDSLLTTSLSIDPQLK